MGQVRIYIYIIYILVKKDPTLTHKEVHRVDYGRTDDSLVVRGIDLFLSTSPEPSPKRGQTGSSLGVSHPPFFLNFEISTDTRANLPGRV